MDFQEAYSKGSEAFKQKNFEEARKYLEEAIKLKPNDVYAINRLAMACKELGDFERVKTLLGESLDAQKSQGKKEDLYSNYLLGNAYLESGDVDKAIETLTLTVNQNPNDKYARNSLALAYRTKGDYENCLKVLRKSLEKDPDDLYN
ncbi:MAG: tetratricopeptide repeat protein, partial [Candidatus Riflebacteria bacterium]|nr:tetratricopeptide repeat protein [Candidatus Riflebacteria bacterium]